MLFVALFSRSPKREGIWAISLSKSRQSLSIVGRDLERGKSAVVESDEIS